MANTTMTKSSSGVFSSRGTLLQVHSKLWCHCSPFAKPVAQNGFQWNAMALESFNALESALIFAPVLRLPNFDEQFIVECDASGGGIVAMLQQNHHIAFYS